eukprot:5550263-Alexandrium_andersonii.AAC.1
MDGRPHIGVLALRGCLRDVLGGAAPGGDAGPFGSTRCLGRAGTGGGARSPGDGAAGADGAAAAVAAGAMGAWRAGGSASSSGSDATGATSSEERSDGGPGGERPARAARPAAEPAQGQAGEPVPAPTRAAGGGGLAAPARLGPGASGGAWEAWGVPCADRQALFVRGLGAEPVALRWDAGGAGDCGYRCLAAALLLGDPA